jgi:hypothetical protein
MLLTLIEVIGLVLLFIVIAVVITLALTVVITYAAEVSYVDPLNEGLEDD